MVANLPLSDDLIAERERQCACRARRGLWSPRPHSSSGAVSRSTRSRTTCRRLLGGGAELGLRAGAARASPSSRSPASRPTSTKSSRIARSSSQLCRATPRVSARIFHGTRSATTSALREEAASLGLGFDAVNSNTFQDQPGQRQSYATGSLGLDGRGDARPGGRTQYRVHRDRPAAGRRPP